MDTIKAINEAISLVDSNKVSDGYHTFGELYEFRKLYNAALFNEWAHDAMNPKPDKDGFYHLSVKKPKYDVHKSWRHNDGELCFRGGWFIVVAMLPTGQITNHYEEKDWDLFKIPEKQRAMFEYDGHTAQDVVKRMECLFENKK